MSNFPLEVVGMLGQTIAKVVPITIALALVFSVLTHFWACNPGTPWGRKRELVTDICYWFFVPLFARVLRIGLLVLGAGVIFNIHDADELIASYDNGHGPLSQLPGRFRSGISFLEPSGCRKTDSPTTAEWTIRRSRPRLADNWPIRSGTRLTEIPGTVCSSFTN